MLDAFGGLEAERAAAPRRSSVGGQTRPRSWSFAGTARAGPALELQEHQLKEIVDARLGWESRLRSSPTLVRAAAESIARAR